MSVVAALVLIAAMVTVFPIGLFLTGALVAGLHGHLQTTDAEDRFEGSELLRLGE